MKQVKIENTTFECISAIAKIVNSRNVIDLKLKGTYDEVITTFVDDAAWSIQQDEVITNEDGTESTVVKTYDKSEYCVAGAVTDNRDTTIDVIMGKKTELEQTQEALDELLIMMVEE